MCTNCGTTTTPLWRRAPNGDTICNACGLYLKARNNMRPPTLKRNSRHKSVENGCAGSSSSGANPLSGSCPGGGQCNGTGGSSSCAGCPAFNQHQVNRQSLVCANCRTSTTPLWRRDEANNTICNACGLYYKLHNVHRPVSMKRSIIKRRKRIAVTDHTTDEEPEEEEQEKREVSPLSSTSSLSPTPSPISNTATITTANAARRRKRTSSTDTATTSPITTPPIPRHEHPSDTPTGETQVMKKAKRHRVIKTTLPMTTTASSSSVPPIEDYIVPKRSKNIPSLPPTPSSKSSVVTDARSTMGTWERRGPSPRTPPIGSEEQTLPHIEKMVLLPSQIEKSFRFPSQDHQQHDISSSSSSSASSQRLPPIHLPSITATGAPAYPELNEFDATLAHLQRLRQRVKPDQIHAFSQLLQAFKEIEFKAEAILENPPNETFLGRKI
ncbi:putative electron transfer flavoprotein subunit [Apophysomyces ossiformis]|uniref:Putative electron transfer flavoprotein subunit n=1 Tax=Apophysomyces ossiformis TaxID=679940 RepID=A0A8H7BG91_9FUNG|nr:putative electron transfer flavoprotein subunit [Apophysomyces ossiformis]